MVRCLPPLAIFPGTGSRTGSTVGSGGRGGTSGASRYVNSRLRSPLASTNRAIVAFRLGSWPRKSGSGAPSGCRPSSACTNSSAKSGSRYLMVVAGLGSFSLARFRRTVLASPCTNRLAQA